MIGSNFEIAVDGVARVGWIKSDGSSFIDLDIPTSEVKKIELDGIFPNGTSDGPGCIVGAGTDGGDEAFAIWEVPEEQTIYSGLDNAPLTKFYDSNDNPADCVNTYQHWMTGSEQYSITYVQQGKISTDSTGAVTALTISTMPFGRSVSTGGLVWCPPHEYSAAKGVTVTKTVASESMSETFDWGGEFTVTLDVANLSFTIYDNATGEMFFSGRYVAPDLRTAETEYVNHLIGFEYGKENMTWAGNFPQTPVGGFTPPLPCNGSRRKLMYDYLLGGTSVYGKMHFGMFLLDRTYAMNTVFDTYNDYHSHGGWRSKYFENVLSAPSSSLFLFARNDGLLNPTNINSSVRIYGVKIYTNPTSSGAGYSKATLARNLVAATKSGQGAGLYDILSGRFYPNSGSGNILYGN